MRIAVATLLMALCSLLGSGSAGAAIPDVFDGDVACTAQPANGNVRLCPGPTTTWDGVTKVDVNVILPPEPGMGADGPYPTIGVFHGWGGSKIGLNARTAGWAQEGYAVFTMSARGWGNSCGAADPSRLTPACAAGYNHLMDTRYEVRDAQYLLSVLADEGVTMAQRIGATGGSYGGGLSMALAALRDRVMLPDGSLAPWTSPDGTPMEVAAAVPQWPWTDLPYSLVPNGRTLDYVADAPYRGPFGTLPIGVEKLSFVGALFSTGALLSNYAPAGSDPDADLISWFGLVGAGEPYDSNPAAVEMVEELTAHHSSYYIDHSRAPAPLLIQSGWNDDLFPVDEAIRFYNRTRSEHSGDPISLLLIDVGHDRDQNKAADVALFNARQDAWLDHYLKGEGSPPPSGVEVLTTTCGGPSEGPFTAPTWSALAPGEIRLSGPAAQTVEPFAGNPTSGLSFDPISGPGACATTPGADVPGTGTYRLPPAPSPGFTLAGSPTVIADLQVPAPESSLAARLLDVAPSGQATLVARGLLRPGGGNQRIVFQLHPQAYRFATGHVAKLELLPTDAPYARPSNAQEAITVSGLQLGLPVLEAPGALGGLVRQPAPRVLPPGYRLAADEPERVAEEEGEGGGGAAPSGQAPPAGAPPRFAAARLSRGGIVAGRRALSLPLRCDGPRRCRGSALVQAYVRRGGESGRRLLARGPYSLSGGASARARIPLSRAGRRLVEARREGAGKPRLVGRIVLMRVDHEDLVVPRRPIRVADR